MHHAATRLRRRKTAAESDESLRRRMTLASHSLDTLDAALHCLLPYAPQFGLSPRSSSRAAI